MATEITYNGVTSELDGGKTATLECNGKKMKSDIVITFGSNGSITYNGIQTDVETGKTATLQCAGKKMMGDLVIVTAESVSDKIVYDGDVQLPPISAELLAEYPYAWIRKDTTHYHLLLNKKRWFYGGGFIHPVVLTPSKWYRVKITSEQTASQWEKYYEGILYPQAMGEVWSSHDILNGSPTASSIYFKGDNSVSLDGLPTISGTWNFKSTITLPNEYVTDITHGYYVPFTCENRNANFNCFEIYKESSSKLYLKLVRFENGSEYTSSMYNFYNNSYVSSLGYTSSVKYTFESQLVTQEFYDWFTANATKIS